MRQTAPAPGGSAADGAPRLVSTFRCGAPPRALSSGGWHHNPAQAQFLRRLIQLPQFAVVKSAQLPFQPAQLSQVLSVQFGVRGGIWIIIIILILFA